ncbi:MAG: NAD-dependent epimerase/dehydratase family protein [Angustibacter sp.]
MPDQNRRTVAVIGANGFLGALLVDALLDQGARVHAFDRYSTSPRHRVSADVTLFQGDLLSRTSLAAATSGVQDVFHFLSLTNPQLSARDPMHDISTNVVSGVELFSLCARANAQRIFFASSGGTVYGGSRPPHAETSPRLPLSPYGIGKVSLENYLQFFKIQHGLESVSLRISNPYGPGQKLRTSQGIIPLALRALRDGRRQQKFGDGSMIRDYIYAADLINMIIRIWHEPRYDTYNLASGDGTSLNSVFETIEQVTGQRLQVEEVPSPPSFVTTSVLDMTRYIDQFGYPALTPMSAGIAETWEYIRDEAA